FEASLPTPEQNQSFFKLVTLLKQYRAEMVDRPTPTPLASDGTPITPWSGRALNAIAQARWPADDPELNSKLDEFAARDWINELRTALSLPLGSADLNSVLGPNNNRHIYSPT